MIVTVSESNDIQTFKLSITDESLFTTLKSDSRSRVQETKITAEALLPDGPYDLWQEGDTVRRVKDLSGAFAQLPHLPKMLNASAILETLLDGCTSGDFVLQLKRPDKTVRTWWMCKPDEEAMKDPDLEVALSEHAQLSEIPSMLLRRDVLPGLWESKCQLPASEFLSYFGGKVVQIEKGGYTEGRFVPKASRDVVLNSIAKAVEAGDLWLVSGPTSLWKEEIPAGVLTESAAMLPPPEPIVAAAILEGNIPGAWKDGKSSVAGILAQLSAQRGMPLPWPLLAQAIDGALRSRLVELPSESASWPCDPSAAPKVILKAVAGASIGDGGQAGGGTTAKDQAITFRSYLQPNELQDLADNLTDILALQAKHGVSLRFLLTVEASAEGGVKEEVSKDLQKILEDISDSFH